LKNKINLYHGDCLVEMNKITNNSIDLILCDLPYGTTDTHGKKNKGSNRLLNWDNIIPLDLLWEQYKRILNKKHGVVVLTADQPFTSQLVLSNIDWFKYEWIWKKNRVTGFLHANYRPMKQTEDVLIFSPVGATAASYKANKCMRYNPQGLEPKIIKKKNNPKRLGNFLHKPKHMGKGNKLLHETEYEQKFTNYPSEIIEFGLDKAIHPTQKPEALMEYLIKTYSNEGDMVLDNCMGSGTTGVACVKTNRKFIGIEKDENFYNIASNRIKETNPISTHKTSTLDDFF